MNWTDAKVDGVVTLKDQQPISADQFEVARRICHAISDCVERRPAYVHQRNLDENVFMPGGIWGNVEGNPIYQYYRFIVDPKYEAINNLRLFSRLFTGYDLQQMDYARGKPIILDVRNADAALVKRAAEGDVWVDRFIRAVGSLPDDMIVRVPNMLGELGWRVNGITVNHDTYVYQERICLLFESGVMDWLRTKSAPGNPPVNILEIGGGYGALAYQLKRIAPRSNYYIVDIPESLLFSCLYLALTRPDCPFSIYDGSDNSESSPSDLGFHFIPNHMFDHFIRRRMGVDLAINTLSFSEMSEQQLRYYAINLTRSVGVDGVLFEQNQDNRSIGHLYSKIVLPDYFKFRRALKPFAGGLTEGVADVWSNKPLDEILGSSKADSHPAGRLRSKLKTFVKFVGGTS